MTEIAIIGIALLFCVSLVTRIIPAFISLPFSKNTQENIKTLLPVSVFINLLTYCVVAEIDKEYMPAIIGFIVLFFMLFMMKRLNLLLMIFVASIAFILTARLF